MTVQPEEDGRLQCLECGRWYRLLPPHLGRAHGMTAAQYRATHQLPRRLGLRAADLRERASEQGRQRYAQRPDIRAAFEAGRQAIDLAQAVAANRETARYEMTRAAHRAGGQSRRAAARRRMDRQAHLAGFPTLAAFLAARHGVPVARQARELGVPRTTLNRWRADLGT